MFISKKKYAALATDNNDLRNRLSNALARASAVEAENYGLRNDLDTSVEAREMLANHREILQNQIRGRGEKITELDKKVQAAEARVEFLEKNCKQLAKALAGSAELILKDMPKDPAPPACEHRFDQNARCVDCKQTYTAIINNEAGKKAGNS